MKDIRCSTPNCKSTSFRKMYESPTGTSVKCNVCGRLFVVQKAKTASTTASQGRAVYGDKPSYRIIESDNGYRRDDDDYNRSSSNYESSSSSSDSFGGGSSSGGGSSDDW